MRVARWLLAFVGVATLLCSWRLPSVSGASCEALSSASVCSGVLPYSNVSISGACADLQESAVSQLRNVLSILPEACGARVAALSCARAFPSCQGLAPCRSMCNDTRTTCGAAADTLAHLIDLDCSTMPTEGCYAPTELPSFVPASPSCATLPATDDFCGALIGGHQVYVPAGQSLATLSGTAAQLGSLMSFLPSSAAGTACKQLLRKQICSNVFLGCTSQVLPSLGLDTPVPFPRFQCRGDCAEYKAACIDSGLLQPSVTAKLPTSALDFLTPNCTAVGEKVPAGSNCGVSTGVPGLPDFPVNSTIYPASSSLSQLTVPCNSDVPPASSVPAPATLLQPLASTSFCQKVLPPSYTESVNVFGGCQDYQEGALSSVPQLLSALTNPSMGLPDSCALAVAQYTCVQAFPNSAGQPACSSMCAAVLSECGGSDPATSPAIALLSAVLDLKCASLPSTDCYAPSATPSFTPSFPSPPRCVNYTLEGGSVCSEIVNYPVYLPGDTAFAYLEGTAQQLTFLYNFIPTSSPAGADCYRAFTRQLCTNVFQGCDDQVVPRASGLAAPLPFPRFACRADCEDFTASCSLPPSILAQLPAAASFLAPNCSSAGVKFPAGSACGVPTGSPALDDYPLTNTTFPASGLPPLVTQCNSIAESQVSAVALVSHCPFPLLAPLAEGDEVMDGVACAMPCPYASYSVSEYESTDEMTTALSIVSTLLNGFLLVTWLAFDVKRKQTYVLSFCINVFLLTLAMLIGVIDTGGRPSRIGCKTETHTLKQDDTNYFCPWQAAFIQVFSLGAVFYWSVIAVDLCLLLVLNLRLTKAQTRVKTICYFAFGSGLPVLLAVIVAATKSFEHSSTLGWCFINTEPPWVEFTFYWGPLIFSMLVGAVCMAALFVTLIKSSRATGTSRKAGAWRQYVRPVLFLSEFCCVFGFILSYKFNGTRFNDSYAASLAEYIECLLGPGGGTDFCGHHAEKRPNISLWRTMHFGLTAQGLLNWLIYGTQKDNYSLWLNLCFRGLGFSQKGSRTSESTDAANSARTNRQMERAATGLEMKNGGSARDLNGSRGGGGGGHGQSRQGSRIVTTRDTGLPSQSSVPPAAHVHRPLARNTTTSSSSQLSSERLAQHSSSTLAAMQTQGASGASRLVSQLTSGSPVSASTDAAPLSESPLLNSTLTASDQPASDSPQRPLTPPPSSYRTTHPTQVAVQLREEDEQEDEDEPPPPPPPPMDR